MIDKEKTTKELESLRDICNAKSYIAVGKGRVVWAGYANAAADALALLKEQERTGSWKDNGNGTISCSECGTWFPKEREPYLCFCGWCGAKMEGR